MTDDLIFFITDYDPNVRNTSQKQTFDLLIENRPPRVIETDEALRTLAVHCSDSRTLSGGKNGCFHGVPLNDSCIPGDGACLPAPEVSPVEIEGQRPGQVRSQGGQAQKPRQPS